MPPRSIFDVTNNFIRLYLHNCGVSQVPDAYNVWCGISLLAAALSKNVWLQKFRGRPDTRLYPNLYIFLLGPSSIGKDTAANIGLGLIKDNEYINTYLGELTAASLKDHLCAPRRVSGEIIKDNTMYLVTPELSDSIGAGPLADRFIKFITGIYGCAPVPFKEGTRTHGTKVIKEPCVNWLGGSTLDWLMDSVPPAAIISGFFARVISVNAEYNLSNRVTFPFVPPDYKEVREQLIERINWMCLMARGEYIRTAEAESIEHHWHSTRLAPEDPLMVPIWLREHDHVLKLAMIFAAADTVFWERPTPPLIIEGKHMINAQEHMTYVRRNIEDVIKFAMVSSETRYFTMVEDKIQKAGRIQRGALLKSVKNRGVSRRTLDECLATLFETGQVRIESGSGSSIFYIWKKSRNYLGEVKE